MLKKILNFNIFALIVFFTIIQSKDCDRYDVINICDPDGKVFNNREFTSKKNFSEWKKENVSTLVNYYQAHSESKSSLSGLETQAKRRLASRINVYIEGSYNRISMEDLNSFNQSMSTSHYEFYRTNLKNPIVINVKEGDMYTVYVYKCKESYQYDDCINKNKLSNYIEISIGNVKEITKTNNKNKRMMDIFYELTAAFLYVHSLSDSDPQIKKLKDEIEDYFKNTILLPLQNSINVEESEIILTPYIYIDKDIMINIDLDEIQTFNSVKKTFKTEYIDWDDFINGFRLIATHQNGNSSWKDNYSSLEPISNEKTLLYPGMLLSSTPKQKINIYADYLFFINRIKETMDFEISNKAVKNLEKFIKQYSFGLVKIKSESSLPTEITFDDNLSPKTIKLITNTLIKTENSPMSDDKEYLTTLYNFDGCEKEASDCFEMNFEKSQDENYILTTLYTPEKNKKKSINLYISDNSIKNLKNSLSKLHQKLSKSNLDYNFCEDISLSINGNAADSNFNSYEVSGNTDIEVYYNYKGTNRLILDTTLLIYQQKDLVDFESLDIFSLKERKLCYNNKNIIYEVSFKRKAGNKGIDNLKGLMVDWNKDKFVYNNYLRKFIKNNDNSILQNPILIKQNFLDINKIKIRKNGYNTYVDNKVQPSSNFRGQYPFEITMESNDKFDNLFHYVMNLLIPGKGQVQFYKTSNFNKLRGILVGLGSYYFAYEMSNYLNDYNYYNTEYNKYFNLYQNENDNELINLYRIKAEENAISSNYNKEEAVKFGLISSILFSLNAIEITLIHIEF